MYTVYFIFFQVASATATRFGLSRGLLGLQYDQINESESESESELRLVDVKSQGHHSLLAPSEMKQVVRRFNNFLGFLPVNVNEAYDPAVHRPHPLHIAGSLQLEHELAARFR